MNQPWHDLLFLMVGLLVGLPCGFIALMVKLGIEQEKKKPLEAGTYEAAWDTLQAQYNTMKGVLSTRRKPERDRLKARLRPQKAFMPRYPARARQTAFRPCAHPDKRKASTAVAERCNTRCNTRE